MKKALDTTKRPARVFVTQDLGFDYSDAESFGELIYLIERREVSEFNVARCRALIRKRLWDAGFSEGDFLLAVGAPAILALAALEAGKLTKYFSVLQWDREEKKYYAINLEN